VSEPYPSTGDDEAPSSGATAATGARAGFWRRFVASFVDGIIIGVVYVVVALIVSEDVATGVNLGFSLAYYTYFEGSSGQTLGKRALGIKVVDISGGGSIGYGRAFIRWIGRIVSSIPLFLGYFWMLWDKEKQTWHDKFAKSIVVPDTSS